MSSVIKDFVGIESAGEKLGNALKETGINATIELRNVALITINYIKSFTPMISLILVFLILLLLVGILSALNRVLAELQISRIIRRRILLPISLVLYVWLVVVQGTAAVREKSVITFAIATMACIGLVVIIVLWIWLTCRNSTNSQSKLENGAEMGGVHRQTSPNGAKHSNEGINTAVSP